MAQSVSLPEHCEAWTAIAIGYEADPATLPAALMERDLAPRQRKPLREFVFTGHWGQVAPLAIEQQESRVGLHPI